jgi:O-antigen/teichoic acid export membrane protein
MVFAAVHQLIASFSSGLVAGFGELMVSQNRQALLRAYANFEYIYYAVMTWAYVTAAALIMPFIELYTRGVQDANYIRPLIAALFVVVGVANNIRVPANTLVNSAGHFRETRKKAIIEAAINLIVSIVMVRYLGIAGVLLGSVCSYAYRTMDFVLYVAANILEQSSWPSWRRIIRNIAVGSLALLPFVIYGQIPAAGYLQWFLRAALVGTAAAAVIIAANWLAEPQMFRETRDRLKMIFHNIAGARPV